MYNGLRRSTAWMDDSSDERQIYRNIGQMTMNKCEKITVNRMTYKNSQASQFILSVKCFNVKVSCEYLQAAHNFPVCYQVKAALKNCNI